VHQFFSEMTPTKQTSQPDKRTKNQRNYVHFTLSVAIAAARQTGSKPPLSGEGDQRSWWRGSFKIFCIIIL